MVSKSFSLAILLLVGVTALQAAPTLTPGKWRITSTVEAPMMPNAQQQVKEECITRSKFDYKSLMAEMPADSCTSSKPKTSGKTIHWEISCTDPTNPAQKFSGKGYFTGNGKSGEGEFEMTMTLPGIGEQTLTSRWQHEYLGKCD